MVTCYAAFRLLDDKERVIKRNAHITQNFLDTGPARRKATVLQENLEIFPRRFFHHTKCAKRNFICIVFDFDFFVAEININRSTELLPVHVVDAQSIIRVVTEMLSFVEILVYRLAGNFV